MACQWLYSLQCYSLDLSSVRSLIFFSYVVPTAHAMFPYTGPLIGGFVGETIGWRWEYWILLIFVSAECIMTLFVPETFAVVFVFSSL